MAPIAMPCEVEGCGYATVKYEPAVAVELLKLHYQLTHMQAEMVVQQDHSMGRELNTTVPRQIPYNKYHIALSEPAEVVQILSNMERIQASVVSSRGDYTLVTSYTVEEATVTNQSLDTLGH